MVDKYMHTSIHKLSQVSRDLTPLFRSIDFEYFVIHMVWHAPAQRAALFRPYCDLCARRTAQTGPIKREIWYILFRCFEAYIFPEVIFLPNNNLNSNSARGAYHSHSIRDKTSRLNRYFHNVTIPAEEQ